ncbi:hypothetical protein [Streptomyces sp. B6B3]|uniref:hypothetical protein n=1 Tax=Streptomyces sp. B6B3 TaxID=3153570 RepID=UPI00325F53F0
MRNDLETREIADDELDMVAGGMVGDTVTINGGLAGALVTDVIGTVNSTATGAYVQGVVGQVTSQVESATGLHIHTGAGI